jgi:hypothetical protein
MERHKTWEDIQANSSSAGHHVKYGGLQMMGSLAGSLLLCEEAVQVFNHNGEDNFDEMPGTEATAGHSGAVNMHCTDTAYSNRGINVHSTWDMFEPSGNDTKEA